ncbi:MAG TPA: class I SAM-dependent methyltransferase, partial [Anaerolineales bacterium]|nr:class I SAM-dependent methyltransferase [Anaerolineales bacterium]
AILRAELGQGPHRILDCACGIGTQTIGLALLGHDLTATDLSPKAAARARAEAQKMGLTGIHFDTLDFFSLGQQFSAEFDAVLACDNALPHLLSEDDIHQAASNFRRCLKPEGMMLISTRDYDKVLREHPSGTLPGRIVEGGHQRIVFQLWDWTGDSTYKVEIFLLTEDQGEWEVKSMQTTYRAWRRAELNRSIGEAGFRDLRWLDPEETGFFQPILIAKCD